MNDTEIFKTFEKIYEEFEIATKSSHERFWKNWMEISKKCRKFWKP